MTRTAVAAALGLLLTALLAVPADAALSAECQARLAQIGHSAGAIPADVVALCQQGRAIDPEAPLAPTDLAYGQEAVNGEYMNIVLNAPGTFNVVAPLDPGEDFVNGIEFDNSGTFTENYILTSAGSFFSVDTATGATTPIGTATAFGDEAFVCLATDPTTGTLYAGSSACGATSSLYTIDWETGAATRIGAVPNVACLIGCAVDGSGQMYGYELIDNNFLSIDKATAASTVVGPIGFNANFGQGMEFDESDGTCYMFAFNADLFAPELRTCNPATGATTLVGTLGDGELYQWGSAAINTGGQRISVLEIPTLGALGLGALAALLGGAALLRMRRRAA